MDIHHNIKSIASSWPTYTLLGSFVLYITGYLSLRFHLTVLGIGTDLTILDEKYIFTGTKFLVFFISSIPISLLLFFLFIYSPIKLIASIVKKFSQKNINNITLKDTTVAWIGVIVSMVIIQLVMRQPFILSNLLVSKSLPESIWLTSILLKETVWVHFYFPLLILGVIFTASLSYKIKNNTEIIILKSILFSLLIIQIFLLPVNYGSLILDKVVPRVSAPSYYKDMNHEKTQFWLVWEGKIGITYLTRYPMTNERTLVTINKGDINFQEILCYDEIITIIFGSTETCI